MAGGWRLLLFRLRIASRSHMSENRADWGLRMKSDLDVQSNQKYARFLVVVLFNIVIAIVLYFFSIYLVATLLKEVFSWFSCVSQFWVVISLAVGLFFFFHFAVRYMRGFTEIWKDIRILHGIISLIDFVHPRELPGFIFIIGTIFSLLFFIAVFFFPPFYNTKQANPVIRGFIVTYIDGSAVRLGSGESLVTRTNEKLLIEVEFLDKTSAECAWTALKGTVLKTGDCSVQYIPPIGAKTDAITVKVKPLCTNFPIIASLPIEVMP